MQPEQMRLRHIVAYVIGGVEGLLLARLVLRLFAARPDNPFVPVFLGATAPLVAPLAFLDAGQPRFGATLEISTLALVALLALAGAAIRMLARSADRRTQ
jgi:YggT family protein